MKTVIKCTDGSVAVMTLVDGADFAEALSKWGDVNPGQYLSHREVDDAEIPTDRTFRNAWEDSGKIGVNTPKAREIHKDRLRQIRAPLLAALDVEYQRADESETAGEDINDQDSVRQARAEKARISAKKQALRDVTKHPAITAAKTPDELKAAIPDTLK